MAQRASKCHLGGCGEPTSDALAGLEVVGPRRAITHSRVESKVLEWHPTECERVSDGLAETVNVEIGELDDLVEEFASFKELEDEIIVFPRLGKVEQPDNAVVLEPAHDLHFFEYVGALLVRKDGWSACCLAPSNEKARIKCRGGYEKAPKRNEENRHGRKKRSDTASAIPISPRSPYSSCGTADSGDPPDDHARSTA